MTIRPSREQGGQDIDLQIPAELRDIEVPPSGTLDLLNLNNEQVQKLFDYGYKVYLGQAQRSPILDGIKGRQRMAFNVLITWKANAQLEGETFKSIKFLEDSIARNLCMREDALIFIKFFGALGPEMAPLFSKVKAVLLSDANRVKFFEELGEEKAGTEGEIKTRLLRENLVDGFPSAFESALYNNSHSDFWVEGPLVRAYGGGSIPEKSVAFWFSTLRVEQSARPGDSHTQKKNYADAAYIQAAGALTTSIATDVIKKGAISINSIRNSLKPADFAKVKEKWEKMMEIARKTFPSTLNEVKYSDVSTSLRLDLNADDEDHKLLVELSDYATCYAALKVAQQEISREFVVMVAKLAEVSATRVEGTYSSFRYLQLIQLLLSTTDDITKVRILLPGLRALIRSKFITENRPEYLQMLVYLNKSKHEAVRDLFKEVRGSTLDNGKLLEILTSPDVDLKQAGASPKIDELEKMLFAGDLVAEHPKFIEGLVRMLKDTKSERFYWACKLAAALLNLDANGKVTEAIVHGLTEGGEGIFEAGRSTCIRYVLENLPEDKRKGFFERLIDRKVEVGPEAEEKIIPRMVHFNEYLVGGTKQEAPKVEATEVNYLISDLRGELGDKPRDIPLLIMQITQARSIYLHHDKPHKIGPCGIDSVMEDRIVETRISANKETKAHRESLACNVALKGTNGKTQYFKIGKDNRLYLRIIKEGSQDTEVDLLEKHGGNEEIKSVLEELYYCILKKLEVVCVRKVEKSKSDRPTHEEVKEPEKPDPKPKEAEAVANSHRTERDHVLDITTDRGEEMAMENIKGEGDDVLDREERRQIAERLRANNSLAGQLVTLYIEGLPEKMPDEFADLLVYQRVPIDGEIYYEALKPDVVYLKLRKGLVKLSDCYIRRKRAHSVALPFFTHEPAGAVLRRDDPRIPEEEREITNDLVGLVTRKKADQEVLEQKRTLLKESGEGYGLDLTARDKFMIFEGDASDENLDLLQVLSERTPEEIEGEVCAQIDKALAENLERMLAERPAHDLASLDRNARMHKKMVNLAEVWKRREVKRALDQQARFALREKVVVDKVTGQTRQKMVVRLPQIFRYKQTFNQGEFETLEDIMEKMTAPAQATKASKKKGASGSPEAVL